MHVRVHKEIIRAALGLTRSRWSVFPTWTRIGRITIRADVTFLATFVTDYVGLEFVPCFPCRLSSGLVFEGCANVWDFLPRGLSLLKGTWRPTGFAFTLREKFLVSSLFSTRSRCLQCAPYLLIRDCEVPKIDGVLLRVVLIRFAWNEDFAHLHQRLSIVIIASLIVV